LRLFFSGRISEEVDSSLTMNNGATVLVVDDEATDIASIRSALEMAGFCVVDANSYDVAVRVFDALPGAVDLLLTDISLPRQNGIELAKVLLRRKPDLKVLFISGHVGAEVIRFYGLPATDRHFLRKPFSTEDLICRVEEILKSADPLDCLAPGERNCASDDIDRT